MVAALDQLATAIASNTLSALQQSSLVQALTVISPSFPSPDESGFTTPPDELLSREWIAALFAIVALTPAGGFALPTVQPAFFLNPVTGSDANSGTTSLTPLKTAAALAAAWRATAGGGRPVLAPPGGVTTITIQAPLPLTDPLAPLLDVDIANGGSLVFVGGLNAPAKTSVLATASAFARTAAAGQIVITDAATPNFQPLVPAAPFLVNSTTGAISWLYGPDAAPSANGTLTVGYSAQVAGVAGVPVQTAHVAGNAYTLSAPIGASLGQGFTTRSFPTGGAAGSPAQVFFYRLDFSEPNPNTFVFLNSPTVTTTFQECRMQHPAAVLGGSVTFANSFFYHVPVQVQGGTSVLDLVFGGGVSGLASANVQCLNGAFLFVDGDFMTFTGVPGYRVASGASLFMGNGAAWNNGGNQAASVEGGSLFTRPIFTGSNVFYGSDGGTSITVNGALSGFGQVLYRVGATAVAQFQLTSGTFKLGDMTSPFGMTIATGALVGPTTGTFAHLDAALAAGTGFGNNALDPSTFSSFRQAA